MQTAIQKHNWYVRNRDKILQKQKAYYTNPIAKAKKVASDALYRKTDAHKIVHRRAMKKYRHKKVDQKFGVIRPDTIICPVHGGEVSGKSIALDHNHSTGKFRGWICRMCNWRLGWFEANRKRIENYLEEV